MKKLLVSTVLFALVSSASAASIALFGQDINGIKGGSDSTLYGVGIRANVKPGLDADFAATTVRGKVSNAMASRIEASLIPINKFGSFTVSTRLTVGNRYISGRNFGFYAIDPTVSVPVSENASLWTGYRFRAAFNDGEKDTTRTAKIGAGYRFTKTDSISVSLENMKGHSNSNAVSAVYIRSF